MEQTLNSAGITGSLAKTYIALLEEQSITPNNLSVKIMESRSNTYKLLDDLVDKGLANKFDVGKKLHYEAQSPTHLLTLAREIKNNLETEEEQLKASIPNMMKTYYKNHEQPGVRFYQGKEEIKEIFHEQVQVGKPIQFLKTRADIDFFGFKYMHEVRNLAPKAKIQRKAFTPDSPEVSKNHKESDKKMLLERTWYIEEDYTAPVEWSVYGNKVSILSFDKEAMGMVIDSPQIAESLRQIFKIMDEGLKRRLNYKKLPLNSQLEDVESFVTKHKNSLPK